MTAPLTAVEREVLDYLLTPPAIPPTAEATPARTSYPALARWWAELRAGTRTRYTADALWRAACADAAARDRR